MRSAVVAVVAAALSVQVALAAPAHLTAQLRAAGGCAPDCRGVMARECDCCHVTQGTDGLRAVPPSGPKQSPVALLMSPVPVATPPGAPASVHGSDLVRNGPPLFLALCSLRR